MFCKTATAMPFDNLSVNDIAPKTNAPFVGEMEKLGLKFNPDNKKLISC
jgi:hypothetical protein